MKCNTWSKPLSSVLVILPAMLLAAWTGAAAGPPQPAKATPASPSRTPVQRLIVASAGFTESNRFWTIGRADHLQFDPFLETLLDVDPYTGAFTPRLAESWQASPDLKGVPVHFGFGELTAKDVVHTHSLMLRPDATATLTGFWHNVEEIKVIDDHKIVFRLKQPVSTMPYAASRAGDLRIVSKTQWEQEGLASFTKGYLVAAKDTVFLPKERQELQVLLCVHRGKGRV